MKSSKKSKKGWTDRFKSKKSAKWFNNRIVSVGGKQLPYPPDDDEDNQVTFCDNQIKSSKYNIFTFWIINPLEQFRRVANFYFLIVAIIQLSLPEPPVSPFTSVAPLVFVIVTTMIKQGYEDYCRHKSDRQINHRKINILKDGKMVAARSEKILVGDIVKVVKNETFPCDLVLLSSSNPNGKCFVMTANLDGETNLKPLFASKETKDCNTPELLANLQGQVECQNPNTDLLSFKGRIKRKKLSEQMIGSLSLENIAMRGTQLENTDFVFGVAVYTGRDTKMSMNSKLGANKFSTVEHSMNKVILVYIGILILEIIVCSSLKYSLGYEFGETSESGDHDKESMLMEHWYLGNYIPRSAKQVFEDIFSFLVIFNNIVPISLYVTLEVQKFVGSMFLEWDRDLYDPDTDEPAKCNSSDLNEELGQIEILFSDKTGTLTENIMLFKEASINGIQYSSNSLKGVTSRFSSFTNDSRTTTDIELKELHQEVSVENEIQVCDFLTALSVCHTVQVANDIPSDGVDNAGYVPDHNYEQLEYNAASPDEKALIEACASFGIKFIGEEETDKFIICRILETRDENETVFKEYKKLFVLEFDSTRKRMSVIVRYPCGKLMLVTKGAESSVLPRCISGPINATNKHIDEYALVGLRTLAIGVKELTNGQLEWFEKELSSAQQSIDGREEKIMAVYDQMERGYMLLGATAVEDKLQDGVKETLVNLGLAGISVWILTGDKKETAINISYSCGHLQPGMTVLDVTGQTNTSITKKLQGYADQVNAMEDRYGLVVDGSSLTLIMPVQENKELLYQISAKCTAVVCCRMSPLQKSEIVKMMKNSSLKPITAAVGDGGNDVAMIQEAHVGLGIMGKEGRAAVRAADFAFSKFKFLQKIILVHGHWYYHRVSMLVHYFFYKNVACFGGQLFWQFFNNYSIQTLYDSFNLTLYNITWTSLPIFIFGLLEQNLKSKVLLNNPVLYKRISKNYLLSLREFFLWFLYGLWHTISVFFGWYLYFVYGLNITSRDELGQFSFGFCIYASVVTIVNLKLWFQSRSWSVPLIGSIIFSVIIFVGFNIGLGYLRINVGVLNFFNSLFGDPPLDPDVISVFPVSSDIYQVYPHVLSSYPTWLYSILIIVVALFPDIVVRVFRKHWHMLNYQMMFTRRCISRKFNRGSFEPNKSQPYFNPVFDEFENGIIGRKITPRKSSSASVLC